MTGYSLARRTLKPIALLATSINQIQATDLSSVRLPIDRHVHDELTDLAATFNAMLTRLDSSFQRERRFTANAAHQLLNPLANLLDNAIKYTPPGASVTLELKQEENTAHLTVSDTGGGFESAEKDLLFERFFRSDLSEVQAQPGSGLGLAIVQTIVEYYGGTIAAHSKSAYTGSTFDITFPTRSTSDRV